MTARCRGACARWGMRGSGAGRCHHRIDSLVLSPRPPPIEELGRYVHLPHKMPPLFVRRERAIGRRSTAQAGCRPKPPKKSRNMPSTAACERLRDGMYEHGPRLKHVNPFAFLLVDFRQLCRGPRQLAAPTSSSYRVALLLADTQPSIEPARKPESCEK